MKRCLLRALGMAGKLCVTLAAWLGCTRQDETDQPRQIHWKGQDTGYEDTTTVQPGDRANAGDPTKTVDKE